MRLPRTVIATMLVLSLFAGALGLLTGFNARLTKSDVINAGADLYVTETGLNRGACLGLPGTPPVWIEVRCGDGASLRTYLFNEKGRRITVGEEPKT